MSTFERLSHQVFYCASVEATFIFGGKLITDRLYLSAETPDGTLTNDREEGLFASAAELMEAVQIFEHATPESGTTYDNCIPDRATFKFHRVEELTEITETMLIGRDEPEVTIPVNRMDLLADLPIGESYQPDWQKKLMAQVQKQAMDALCGLSHV